MRVGKKEKEKEESVLAFGQLSYEGTHLCCFLTAEQHLCLETHLLHLQDEEIVLFITLQSSPFFSLLPEKQC